jgi:uncharacterized protein (TIGR02145 family)
MEKYRRIGFTAGILFCLVLLLLGCKKDQNRQIPILVTFAVSNIKNTSVDSGGNITSEGSEPVKVRGVCWSVLQNPTIAHKDSTTSDGKGPGNFTSTITGMKQGANYYIRAYATSSVGTAYGNQVVAALPAVLPTVTTSLIVAIDAASVKTGGVVTNNGGSKVITRGVTLSNRQNPIVDNKYPLDEGGVGSFTFLIKGLDADSVYYLRAYATNSIGTAYGNELAFTLSKMLLKDADGNYYRYVTIGSQVWMADNLKTTRFRDSSAIALVDGYSSWSNLITPGVCWYNNDEESFKKSYGALYNWATVSSGKLCPTGWHIPSDSEWKILVDRLGGETEAGGKLKETSTLNWKIPNTDATNETAFNALPGGSRSSNGEFGNMNSYGNWWSSTSATGNVAYYRYLYFGNGTATKSFISQKYGLSVRCVKN